MANSLLLGPVRELEGGLVLVGSLGNRRRAVVTERLKLWEVWEGNLEGRLL